MRVPVPENRHCLRLSDVDGPLWIGANFWSRLGGPLMWRTFDADLVREELRTLVEHGMDLTRSFFYWPDFHPEPERLDERLLDRYGRFLDLHQELGMRTIPTFIVGHMSGANWDPAWRHDRDLYRDVWMVERQAFFLRTATARFHEHPAIAGWLVSNEMPIYGGGGGPDGEQIGSVRPRDVRAWAGLMVQAIRAGGARQPVSLGDGAWGLETTGRDNAYRLRDLIELIDYSGPHAYPSNNDEIRQNMTASYNVELAAMGKPVVLEEFGVTTDFASEQAAGEYYRLVLHTTALAGATGWIAWNNTDFPLPEQSPYQHHPYEMHFGITDSAGRPKPPLHEMHRFRKLADEIDLGRCRRSTTDTSIVVSSVLESDSTFIAAGDRVAIHDVVFQSYISARLADLRPALVRETDRVPGSALIVVPSTKALFAPTWGALEEAARAGSTVLVSYSSGETQGHRGPWWPDMDSLFGVRKLLRYGLTEPVEQETVRWRFTEAFGDLPAGTELSFRVAGPPDARCMLPVEATDARVVAVDDRGRPALVIREVGAGRLVLATYPFEYFAARSAHVNPDDAVRLYRAAAELAGAAPDIAADDPRVFTDTLEHEDGARWAFVVNVSGDAVTTPVRAKGVSLVGPDGHETTEVDLAPYDVAVFAMRA
jgi:endo-1,4-beta-mannosidase